MDRKLKPLKQKLILFIAALLIVLNLAIGIPSYILARKGLEDKGNTILSNAVEMAIKEIETISYSVDEGVIELEDAQELVKTILIGPKNEDNTRSINTPIDLGEHGYFIAYNNEGYEVMHPSLEGEYAYDFVTPDSEKILLVQEQLKVGRKGGYLDYSWYYPNSEDIGRKLSYSKYESNWGWTVVASAYASDFNKSANEFMYIMLVLFILTLTFVIIFSNLYMEKLLIPIYEIIKSMRSDSYYNLVKVADTSSSDEMSQLVKGYNKMLDSLSDYIAKLINNEHQFKRLAYTDELTKLPNKHSMESYIEKKFLENDTIGIFVLIDIKELNLINSIYGVSFGDSMIKKIAEILRTHKPSKNSFVARVTGGEFAIVIPDMRESDFDEWLNQMNDYWKQEVDVNGEEIRILLRYAYIDMSESIATLSSVHQKSNVAMQYAKSNKLEVVKYSREIQDDIEYETVIRLEAEKGIKNDEFYPVYQEQVSTETEKVIGIEALARWDSSVLGFVSPAKFVPVLSNTKLIIDFTEKMIEYIFIDYDKLVVKYGENINISINISPLYFLSEHFISCLLNNAAKYNVKCHNIILEITEDVLMDNQDLVNKRILDLRQSGFKVSLDDFGTGYSSLNYLKNILLDEVKIDKSLVDDIVSNKRSRKMLKSLIDVIHSFDLKTVAEGVESDEQVTIIKEMGCYVIQGYYYSKPERLNL